MMTREKKHDAASRELKMRRKIYPRVVATGRMTQAECDHEIAVMEAIAADYAPPGLFDEVGEPE